MRSGVVIRPGDAAADRDGRLGGIEGKILDLDGNGFRGGVGASIRRTRRGFLSRFGAGATRGGRFDEVDGYAGLVAFRAEPRDTGVPRVVQLAQADDQLALFFALVRGDGAADIATGDVGVDLFGAEVDVDGMTAVDDLLQRHVDDGDAALDGNRGGRTGRFGVAGDVCDVGQRNHHVAQLGARAAVDVGGMDLGFVILRGQPRREQCQRRKRDHRAHDGSSEQTSVVMRSSTSFPFPWLAHEARAREVSSRLDRIALYHTSHGVAVQKFGTPLTPWMSRSYNPTTLRDEMERPWRQLLPRGHPAPRCGRAVRRTWPTKKEALVSKELATRALFADALAGRIDRRTLVTRAAALGLSAPVITALANETARTALAGDEGTLEITSYDWQLANHPGLNDFNADFGATYPIEAEIAPSANFSADVFLSEAAEQSSSWDVYTGVTPFLEMIQLVEADVIEPWDPYLPEGMLDDIFAPIREEGSYKDQFYVWPWLLDVIVQGWNAELVTAAGLDRRGGAGHLG